MTLNSEKLILDRDKLIESIWEYRWWILDNSQAMYISVIQEKQYKLPQGKHIDIQPTDILKAKKKGYSEWRRARRGYKDIFKWYCLDSNQQRQEDIIPLDTFNYYFSKDKDLEDYQLLLSLDYDDLIGLNFALITYLSRYQPLKKKSDTFFQTFAVEDRIQYHFMKELKDISLRSIRLKLKAWVEDDADELDGELGFMTFANIHLSREADYIRKQSDYCFSMGTFAETKEDRDKYFDLHTKWKKVKNKRLDNCQEEAEHYWEHGTNREHLMFQRNGFWSQDMVFSNEQIDKDTKRIQRIVKARRKNNDY